jgi:hypothetical protein
LVSSAAWASCTSADGCVCSTDAREGGSLTSAAINRHCHTLGCCCWHARREGAAAAAAAAADGGGVLLTKSNDELEVLGGILGLRAVESVAASEERPES